MSLLALTDKIAVNISSKYPLPPLKKQSSNPKNPNMVHVLTLMWQKLTISSDVLYTTVYNVLDSGVLKSWLFPFFW